ncbi:MAG: cytidylate kinase-like family protein [Deltaproteobacteria bacterium]|nr:cytidylate kinase-like family protein [Deltaproteobacteria bacterium]
MSVVCISRQYGAGGVTVGQMVADRLGYRFVDLAILSEVAHEAHISVEWVAEVERSVGDKLARLVPKILANKHFVRYLPGTADKFEEKRYREFLKTVIAKLGAAGQAVILGRGSQFILAHDPEAVRVLLVAGEEDRVNSLMKRYRLSRPKAVSIATTSEKHRLNFLKAFEAGNPDDPSLYHLVINTSLVGLEDAADLICRLAG